MTLKEQIEKVLLDSIVKDGITTRDAARQVLEIVEKEAVEAVYQEHWDVQNLDELKAAENVTVDKCISRLHSLFAVEKDV